MRIEGIHEREKKQQQRGNMRATMFAYQQSTEIYCRVFYFMLQWNSYSSLLLKMRYENGHFLTSSENQTLTFKLY